MAGATGVLQHNFVTRDMETDRDSIIDDLAQLLRPSRQPCVVTMGKFDGVHDGHRAVLDLAREHAIARGLAVIALTFSPRPDQVLCPGRALPELLPLPERISCLLRAGADDVVVVPFSRRLAAVPALQFVRVLGSELGMQMLCVGEDFALGRHRAGTVEALRAAGVEVATTPLVHDYDGVPLSSSAIRRSLVAKAAVV